MLDGFKILLISVTFIVITFTCGSVKANEEQDSLSARTSSEVLAYDFSSAWESQVLIDYRGASQRTDNLIGVRALAAETYHSDDDDLLGMKIIGSDIWWTTNTLLTKIASYLAVDNSLPANAAELFPELGTPEGFAEFNALYPTQQLAQYGMAVNFATKRFYQDFRNPDWRPGGLYIELLQQNAEGQFIWDGKPYVFDDPGDPETAGRACYYRLYSAAEGKVLYEDFFTFQYCRE